MATLQAEARTGDGRAQWESAADTRQERWVAWPVNWSAVCVGALASLAAILIFGLIGTAIGAHVFGPEHRIVDLRRMALVSLIFSVASAFFAFVIGGWVAGKVAGILCSQTAILH